MNKQLPASLESEESILSCALIDCADTMAKCLDAGIKPDSFYGEKNRIVFEHLTTLFASGHSADLAMLTEELRKGDKLEEVGGIQHLMSVSNRTATTAQIPYFIERVFDLSQRRKIIKVASDAVEKCYELDGKVGDQLSRPVNDMLTLVAGADTHSEPEWAEVCSEAEKIAQSIIDHKGKPAHMMVQFPWREMNERFNPMERGQLIIVGARPSVGKSSLLRPLALSCAKQGYPVYFVTLEVNPTQVPLQLAAMESKIGMRQLPKAHQKDQESFKKALHDLKTLGITISRRDRNIAKIIGRARAINSKRKLGMVIVDYLGLIDDIATCQQKEKVGTIGMVTKAFQKLAVEEGLVVVLAAQLNRLSAQDGNREPRLSDLRDSGEIEQDADKVIMVHRPSDNPITKMAQNETEPVENLPKFYQDVIQAKGRDDGASRMGFYFDRSTVSYIPVTGQ